MERLGCFHNTDQRGFPSLSLHKIGLMKVLPKSFHLNGHTPEFFPPTHKLQPSTLWDSIINFEGDDRDN